MVYWTIFIQAFLAATILPFGSEIGLTVAFLAEYDAVLLIAVASAGNWLGGLTNYVLGYWGNWERIKKFTGIRPEKTAKLEKYVKRYGVYTAFFCWLPVVGDPLALLLGLFRINPFQTAMFMLIGKALRYIALFYFIKAF
jgi:membrane protein YqaA with SNARE-associated domain